MNFLSMTSGELETKISGSIFIRVEGNLQQSLDSHKIDTFSHFL